MTMIAPTPAPGNLSPACAYCRLGTCRSCGAPGLVHQIPEYVGGYGYRYTDRCHFQDACAARQQGAPGPAAPTLYDTIAMAGAKVLAMGEGDWLYGLAGLRADLAALAPVLSATASPSPAAAALHGMLTAIMQAHAWTGMDEDTARQAVADVLKLAAGWCREGEG